jgi:hypothetical protein
LRSGSRREPREETLCKSVQGKWKSRRKRPRFQSFWAFGVFGASVCGGAKLSQALMFSSPLLLLKRKRKRITDASAVEKWKTPQKNKHQTQTKK